MNQAKAQELAVEALRITEVDDPTPVADTTVLFRNADGTWSVVDNGEEVVCDTDSEAIRIIVENLTAC